MFKVIWETDSLNDLDAKTALQIKKKIDTYLVQSPKHLGKPLSGIYKGMYRYRYGNYRVIYEIKSKEKIIIILKIGHRKEVY